jgi:hypothetical protein
MNLLELGVFVSRAVMTVRCFDAPQGCSFYRLVLVDDARIVW